MVKTGEGAKVIQDKGEAIQKDQANVNVLMETHANKMKQFESEKKDHLEEVEEKQRYYRELDAHYKSMRKELDEEWDLKAANEK